MIALRITSLKHFMNQILAGDAFDIFLLEEAAVAGACTYSIDGHLNRDFYEPDEWEDKALCPYEFAAWQDMRGLLYDLIKGKHTPLHFKFVLLLKPAHLSAILKDYTGSQIKALVLTVKYEGGQALLLTGTSFHTFVMDKEPDKLWDAAIVNYLAKKEIACEVL